MPSRTGVPDPIEDYLFATLDLSAHTQRWYRVKLETFRAWCAEEGLSPTEVRRSDVGRYVEWRKNQKNPQTGRPISGQTVRGDVQVIKGFLRWCLAEEVYGVSERVPRSIVLPRADAKVIEVFTREQIKQLLQATHQEYNRELQVRDVAIIRTLLSTGLRASELVGLTLSRTFLTAHDPHLKVLGKGRKEREVPLGQEARQAVYRYQTRYRRASGEEPHLFLNRSHQPMTPDGLDQMLYRLRDWSGVQGVRVSAHTFRHTFAVEYLRQGGDVYRLSKLLGHSTVGVTEIYLRAFTDAEARRGVRVFDDL